MHYNNLIKIGVRLFYKTANENIDDIIIKIVKIKFMMKLLESICSIFDFYHSFMSHDFNIAEGVYCSFKDYNDDINNILFAMNIISNNKKDFKDIDINNKDYYYDLFTSDLERCKIIYNNINNFNENIYNDNLFFNNIGKKHIPAVKKINEKTLFALKKQLDKYNNIDIEIEDEVIEKRKQLTDHPDWRPGETIPEDYYAL